MESENKYIETDLGNIAPNPRGEYEPAAAYEYLDLVEYGGGSYLCIQESGTVTGVAPAQNKNTDTWQVLTIPGDLTPEYIAIHDDVVNKAESAQTDAASTAADREQVESMLANVEQLHTQTETAAQEASDSRDSAAGYATAAEASREAAAESEKNAQLQVTGFDETVNAAKQEATEEIATARKTAVQAVAAQQVKSVNAVNAAGSAAIKQTSADAKDAKDAKAAAVSAANAAEGSARKATAAAEQAENDKQSAETAATAAKSSAAAAETAQKAVEGAAGQIETNTAGIEALKEDVSDLNDKKITKFYASNLGEIHITDSDNGKIQDMILYGKSEQKQYKGINLFPPDTNPREYVEVSIPKGSFVFWVTDGTPNNGGNFRFFNEDKTESMWLGVDSGATSKRMSLTIDAKYVQNLIMANFDLSKICLGVGSEPIYEPYTGGIPSPSPDYPQEIKSVVNPTVKVSSEDETESQTVTLPYTLNAIPVESGGNVTIDGQQYIADYVDVERGKIVRMCGRGTFNTKTGRIDEEYRLAININTDVCDEGSRECIFSTFKWKGWETCVAGPMIYIKNIKKPNNELYTAQELKELSLDFDVIYQLKEAQEIDLTQEEVQALKALATYYQTANISVNSEQLDGYTVFNYPISMQNGWNYVKQQLNDNRDYIYDMDTQSAEAYVNSEYAVALTELEV